MLTNKSSTATIPTSTHEDRDRLVELVLGVSADPPPAYDEFFHDDLPAKRTEALEREQQRLRLAVALHSRPPLWWRERLEAVEAELARRALAA